MALLNGRLPASALGTIPGTARRLAVELVPQTAALRAAFAARFGKPLVVTDAYRTYEEQVRLKQDKGSYAATPGTSNHGWGRAIDFGSGVNVEGSPEYRWMKANAPRFGWRHPLWAEDRNPANGQQEPWHWEASETPVPVSNYTSQTGAVPTAPAVGPIAPIDPRLTLAIGDEMYDFARLKSDPDGKVYVGNGIVRRWVKSAEEFADLNYRIKTGVFQGKWYVSPTTVPVVERIDWLGKDIT